MTPPRMPPPPDADTQYLRYAVAILRALADARDQNGVPTPGNRRHAAAALGISVRALSEHIDALGLRELCRADGQSALWPLSSRQPRQLG
jgi:hypothetical protein